MQDLEYLQKFKGQWFAQWDVKTQGYYATCTLYLGSDGHGKSKNTTMHLHTYLLNHEHKRGIQIDHINHDMLNNRRSNLRVTTKSENMMNRPQRNRNNKSGYRNVFWNKDAKKWDVWLCKNYQRIHVGMFDDVDEAGIAAEEARNKHYGEFAGLN